MARVPVLVACLVLAVAGVAVAGGKTSKVTIETDPPGAKVYFGLKEDGAICTTPCTVEAPIGETPIIVEAESRRSIIENLVVPRKTARPMKVHYTLELAVGTLVVEGGAGGTIKIDDEARGKAPGRVESVPAGAHHVVIEKNGKALYDDFLEIEAGHEATVSPRGASAELAAPRRDEPAGPTTTTTTGPAPVTRSARRGPSIAVTGTMDVGFRHFHYIQNTTPGTQRDDREVGQALAGPIVELWPTTLLGLDVLPGLALYGRFEFGVNSQPVTMNSMTGTRMPTSLSTTWQSFEVSLHQRWTIARTGTIEVGAGYTQDRYQFNGDAADIAIVPDASYKAVRIGGRGSLLFGKLEPYVTIENRLVLSGGAMDKRYSLGTSVNGVRTTLGAAVHLGHVEVRLEGGVTRYSWASKPDVPDLMQATGGSDLIESVTFAVGYAY
jgi:PEGA domain-containing protein